MPNDKVQSSNEIQNPNGQIYELEERTAKFGGDIIDFARPLKETKHWLRMISKANPHKSAQC